jgi:hypothetical protein
MYVDQHSGLAHEFYLGRGGPVDPKDKIVEVQGAHLRRFDKHTKRATLWTLKIFVEAQGADLRRFDKHKKRATLGTGEYPPVMNCTLFAVQKALKYEWVIIPYHLMLYTKGVAE